jgi:hypothetical protein
MSALPPKADMDQELRIALEHLEDIATELNSKWHEDYASLRAAS